MKRYARRCVLGALCAILLLAGAAGSIGPVPAPHAGHAAASRDTPAPGTDLVGQETPSLRLIQQANGQVEARVYAQRVGIVDATGWRFRNPGLGGVAADGTAAALDEPFSLHLAATASAPALASLTNEDGYNLSLQSVDFDGGALPASSPVLSPTAVTFPGPVGGPSITLVSTIAGFTLQAAIPQPSWQGRLGLRLTLDPRLVLTAGMTNTVVATVPTTVTGDDGVVEPSGDPQLVLDPPLVADAGGVSAPDGALSLALDPTAGPNVVALTVDSAWLQDPARQYPLSVSLPVSTALSSVDAGYTSTTQTCGGQTAALAGQFLAGQRGGCSDTGLVYFQTAQIPPGTAIASAGLDLAAVNQPAGSAVLAGAQGSGIAATPMVRSYAGLDAATSAALAQLSPAAGSLTQDVTAALQQWLGDAQGNQGFALTGSGAATTLVSSAEAQSDPALMPMLDILTAPAAGGASGGLQPATVSPSTTLADGASSIWGISGSENQNVTAAIGGRLFRYGAQLPCPGWSVDLNEWWSGWYAQPGHNPGGEYHTPPSNPAAAFTQANANGLIPVVDFGVVDCSPGTQPQVSDWLTSLQYFFEYATAGVPHVYFEIGNEEDQNGYQLYGGNLAGYENIFAQVAYNLNLGLSASPAFPWYRILVGGLLFPMAIPQVSNACATHQPHPLPTSLPDAQAVVAAAEGAPYKVPQSVLGVAVHPYGFTSSIPTDEWPNTGLMPDACTGIDTMLQSINYYQQLAGVPVIFSEMNYVSGTPAMAANLEGNYLLALANYLYLKCDLTYLSGCVDQWATPSEAQIRVLWFSGQDWPTVDPATKLPVTFQSGLFNSSGNEKPYNPPAVVQMPYCGLAPPNPAPTTLADVYMQVALSRCAPSTQTLHGLAFPVATNGCAGPLVAVYGSSGLRSYVLGAAADYCTYELAQGLTAATAPDVEYLGGGDSCPGVGWAFSWSDANELGVSDVRARSCNTAGAGFSFPTNPVTETNVAVNLVDAITHCSGALVPQGGAPGYTTGECLGSAENISSAQCSDPSNNGNPTALTFAAPDSISVQQGFQVWSNSGSDWSQFGGCAGYTPIPQERTAGSGTKITYCFNIFGIGKDMDCMSGGGYAPAGTSGAETKAVCGDFTGGNTVTDVEGTIGMTSRATILVGANASSGPLQGCGLVGLGGASNTGWNGQCNPFALHGTPAVAQPAALTAVNGLDGTTQCKGDMQVINGQYPAWGYGLFDTNTVTANNAAARAFVAWLSQAGTEPAYPGTTEEGAVQEYGFLQLCQMNISRSPDGGPYQLTGATC